MKAIKRIFKMMLGLCVACLGVLAILVAIEFQQNKNEPMVDEDLKAYVEIWKQDCDAQGIEYKDKYYDIQFIELGYPGLNRAGVERGITHTITITPRMSYYETLALVYHELGHAVFDLKHTDGIMSEELANSRYYKDNWTELKSEYFNQIKNK